MASHKCWSSFPISTYRKSRSGNVAIFRIDPTCFSVSPFFRKRNVRSPVTKRSGIANRRFDAKSGSNRKYTPPAISDTVTIPVNHMKDLVRNCLPRRLMILHIMSVAFKYLCVFENNKSLKLSDYRAPIYVLRTSQKPVLSLLSDITGALFVHEPLYDFIKIVFVAIFRVLRFVSCFICIFGCS